MKTSSRRQLTEKPVIRTLLYAGIQALAESGVLGNKAKTENDISEDDYPFQWWFLLGNHNHQANPHVRQQHIVLATTFRSGLPQPLSSQAILMMTIHVFDGKWIPLQLKRHRGKMPEGVTRAGHLGVWGYWDWIFSKQTTITCCQNANARKCVNCSIGTNNRMTMF